MKSKCGKLKNKGWKAESKIDSWLNKVHTKEIKCSRQGEYLLCEAKTCIQSLNGRIKLLNNLLDKEIDEKYFWKDCCLTAEQKVKEQSSFINQLQFDDDSLSVIVDELRKENDKLRGALLNISFKTPALASDKYDMNKIICGDEIRFLEPPKTDALYSIGKEKK